MPGIHRLTELVVGDIRLHLFERGGPGGQRSHLQPVPVPARVTVVEAPDDLVAFRRRWIELFESGGYAYALPVPPTEIVVDADGVRSSYAYDVNGLEFEFTDVPADGT